MPHANWLVYAIILVVSFPCSAFAEEGDDKLQVFVVTGGHGFERDPFFAMFRDNPAIEYREAKQADTAIAYEREDLFEYDVIVLFDMLQKITPEQKARFLQLCERGVGLVVMHHALVSYQDWPDYERIIGGRYPEDQAHKGQVTKELGYRHDVDIPVEIVAQNHPITAGLTDFEIRDEIYWGFRVADDVTPLISTSHPDSGKPLAWARQEKNSRVVYLQLGDSPSAYGNSSYRRLLAQCIQWVANQ